MRYINILRCSWQKLSEGKKVVLLMAFVAFLSLFSAFHILNAYFIGEDEANFLRLANTVFEEAQRGDFRDVALSLLYHDHPPLPILMVAPFIPLVGYSEAALRLPNILLWSVICMTATWIGWRLGGLRVGFLTGAFLAVSGLFDMFAMGFGLAGENLSVLLLVATLVNDFAWNLETKLARRQYFLGGAFLAVGFLFFTSILPVIGLYHIIFAIAAWKANPGWRSLKYYVLYSLPLLMFYLIYHAIFLGIPAYDVYVLGLSPYGQLAQNLGRAGVSRLNITSLWMNLKVINWFVVPFLSWPILVAGLYGQIRKKLYLFLILLGFGAIWSFYLFGNTGQHFLSYFCWAVPFGIATLDRLVLKLKPFWRVVGWASLLGLIAVWTYQAHVKTYTYVAYPRYLAENFWCETLGWPTNMYRPLRKIANELDKTLGPNSTLISLIDGALRIYYFPGDKHYAPLGLSNFQIGQDIHGQCLFLESDALKKYKIRAIVSYTNQDICSKIVERVVEYPGSDIQLTFIAR